jgi:hypothetical protein
MTSLADDITLTETLRLAVPIHLAELCALPPHARAERARWWATDGARAVGERGDLLQFTRTKNRLRVANTFDQLARGLTALAVLDPDGVDAFGLHWCLNDGCARCNPPRRAVNVAAIVAELERIDREYRDLCGFPPWQPPPPEPEPAPPTQIRGPRLRPVVDVLLPETDAA